MQVNVIQGGSVHSFDYLLFPEQNFANHQYIQNQFTTFSNTLTDIGRKFIESSKDLYEKVNDSNAVRLAKAALRNAKGLFQPDKIVSIDNVEDLRNAQPVMQRYIMAEPTIRELYHKQQCDGYSDTYADIEPDKIGDKHYDYRRVMTGIIVDEVVDGEDSWVSRNYCDDLLGDDRDLNFDEKIDILKTWDIIKMCVSNNQDPTSIYSNELVK